MNFYNPANFNNFELRSAVLQVLGSAPSSPVVGRVWYDSGISRLVFATPGGNIDPTDRANHSGQQLASTISNFLTAVTAARLDQMAAPTALVNMGGYTLTNIRDAINANEPVSYSQFLTVVNGRDFKESVRVATTASITQSGLATVDGVTLVDGDRILDKDNTNAALRGLWVAHTGAWTRPADFVTGEVTASASVMVEEGALNQDLQFTLTTNGTINVGATNLTWQQTGKSTTYVQGTGIVLSGANISIDTAVVCRMANATIGDGTTTSFNISHTLGTKNVIIQVRDHSTGQVVGVDASATSTSAVNVTFTNAPAANSFDVTILGGA